MRAGGWPRRTQGKRGTPAAGRYLGDGEVQPDVDDDGEEEDAEGGHHQQRLLQHEHLVEGVVHLGTRKAAGRVHPDSEPRGQALCPPRGCARGAGVRAYHDVLDVLLHQVLLVGHDDGAAERVQVGVVQLVRAAADLVGAVDLDVPGGDGEAA